MTHQGIATHTLETAGQANGLTWCYFTFLMAPTPGLFHIGTCLYHKIICHLPFWVGLFYKGLMHLLLLSFGSFTIGITGKCCFLSCSLVFIFWSEMCFSNCRRSFTSAPYFPVVPLSARIKWECILLSTVSLLIGLDIVWYGRTTCIQ